MGYGDSYRASGTRIVRCTGVRDRRVRRVREYAATRLKHSIRAGSAIAPNVADAIRALVEAIVLEPDDEHLKITFEERPGGAAERGQRDSKEVAQIQAISWSK